MKRKGIAALATATVGLGAGLVAQRSVVQRRRKTDPEAGEAYGQRRGHSPRTIMLDDGAKIFIEEAGPKSARRGAVFIHGSALRTDLWHYQFTGLGDHRLVFYDLRGHGLSQPKGDSAFSITTLACDLEKVIEDAGLDEVVLVGHSIGGMIALQYCRAHLDQLGDSVKGVILLNTTHHPVQTVIGGAGMARFERLIRRPLDAIGSRSDYVQRLRKIIKPSDSIFMMVSAAAFGPGASAKQIDFLYDMLAETEADVIFDLLKSYRDFEVTDHLGEITVPALVVGGDRDRITVLSASEHLARELPKAELEVLRGCGHMSMLERHREVNRLMTSFLDDVLDEEPNV
ncbi:MAG: alpha/beta hydrolase [Actinobacteria bacterium]|nr:alpha/beta hydrolase [Actinomycetota bacterium]